jgi:hypothetical protein
MCSVMYGWKENLLRLLWKSFSEIHFGSLFENNMLLFVTLVCDSWPQWCYFLALHIWDRIILFSCEIEVLRCTGNLVVLILLPFCSAAKSVQYSAEIESHDSLKGMKMNQYIGSNLWHFLVPSFNASEILICCEASNNSPSIISFVETSIMSSIMIV